MSPKPDNPLYSSVIQQYADQIARALLRRKDNGESDDGIVIGILGDSVSSGTDNCYYDAWPEQFRRQMAPLFGSMGLKLSIRNAAKNGGWLLDPQMLCANDMLGGSDRPNGVGLDFILQLNLFVKAEAIDAEHLIRRALFGKSHTLIAINAQDGMDAGKFTERYASAGLIITSEPSSYWFPRMQSDGFCRIATRAGSAPVVKRNWHWGPLVRIRVHLRDESMNKAHVHYSGSSNICRFLWIAVLAGGSTGNC